MCLSHLTLPSFGINSLFRLNTANISYLYRLVYFSLYNTPVLHLGLISLLSPLSSFLPLVLRLPGALREPCLVLGTKQFLS